MSRLLRLAASACLFAVLATVLLSPQVGQGQFIPADPPSAELPPAAPPPSGHCASCGALQVEDYHNSSISLTEGDADQEYSGGQARSGFGPTLDFEISYNTYDADGSRNMFTKQPGQIDTVMGYGWTHMFNDLLFTQHDGDMFRLEPNGRVTRFALQTNCTYQTSPGYFETLVKSNDGSFDLTTKYQTDYDYAAVPNTPFALGTGPVMRLMSITDRNNNVTSLAYDANGDMTTVTDTYGRTFTFGYNSNHHVSSATDPLATLPPLVTTPQVTNCRPSLTRTARPPPIPTTPCARLPAR